MPRSDIGPKNKGQDARSQTGSAGQAGQGGATKIGEMAERFKALVLKTSVVAIPPWVRIPLSPPTTRLIETVSLHRFFFGARSHRFADRILPFAGHSAAMSRPFGARLSKAGSAVTSSCALGATDRRFDPLVPPSTSTPSRASCDGNAVR